MRKVLVTSFTAVVLAVFMMASGAQAQSAPKSMAASKKVTIEGELIDIRCYSAMGVHGEDHEMCANACAKAGDPVGILDAKGNVYTLGSISKGYDGVMAKMAKIEGTLYGNVLIPKKVEVKDGGEWKTHKLPKEMM